MGKEKSKKETLKQQIYTAVMTDIIHGKFQPKDIINEKGLMEIYGASRAPVREALIALCNEHVLESIPCYGYQVKELSDKDVVDIQRFRIALEVGFMTRYWNMITPEVLDDLEELRDKPEECDVFFHWDHNVRFHIRLMECYDDPYALQQLRAALSVETRAFAQKRWELWHKPLFSERPLIHEEIIDAIRCDRKVLACKLLEADIRTI